MVMIDPALLTIAAVPVPFGNADLSPGQSLYFLLGGMAFILGIIFIGTLEKAQKEKLRHETIRRALEKGQTLPPELLEGRPLHRPRDDRRAGLILVAVGAGVYVFFHALHISQPDVPAGIAWMGMIPGLIGVALLFSWALERAERPDRDKN